MLGQESKEAYFVALRRKHDTSVEEVDISEKTEILEET